MGPDPWALPAPLRPSLPEPGLRGGAAQRPLQVPQGAGRQTGRQERPRVWGAAGSREGSGLRRCDPAATGTTPAFSLSPSEGPQTEHPVQGGAGRRCGPEHWAGASGCAPPWRLPGRPRPLLVGVLAGSAFYGAVPFRVPAKPLPAPRGPQKPWPVAPSSRSPFLPEPLPPASDSNLGSPADPGRLPGHLSDPSHQCDLLPPDTKQCGLGPLQGPPAGSGRGSPRPCRMQTQTAAETELARGEPRKPPQKRRQVPPRRGGAGTLGWQGSRAGWAAGKGPRVGWTRRHG
ncbi:hypothetical protein HJG60_011105 [Phyllostomus discolor]|uniref:Uncharacterized protein n=1 Tax=Phyllostomus discolor TaxID=89673 RepID=A0A834A6X5_9CHIR|nr:hypothetical protein HJG60_011105 [Phyllostomus discolor]